MSLERRIDEEMRIKIMNYNVLHGFHSDKHILEEERLKAAQEAIRAENPDVLVLTEACYGSENPTKIRFDYQESFGFSHFAYFPRGDYEWGSAILSKHPILNSKNNCRGLRQYAEAELDIHGTPLVLGIAHPHPDLTEDEKLQYFKGVVPSELPKRYVLAGDFNSISDQDEYDRDKMVEGFKGFAENPEQAVEGMLQRKALPYLRSRGLIDTYKAVNPNGFSYTIPTDYLSKDKRSGMRMDFIMCSPDFLVEDAYVVQNKNTEKASDHYPVVAVLKKLRK